MIISRMETCSQGRYYDASLQSDKQSIPHIGIDAIKIGNYIQKYNNLRL